MLLDQKVAVVTGAGSGIGRATALAFAAEGARVIAADIASEAAERTAASILDAGGSAEAATLDVSDPQAVGSTFEAVLERHGRLDVLVNNAGIVRDGRLVKMTVDQWDQVIDVNLKGVFLCGQAAARAMVGAGAGGSIVNIASVVALYGNFGQSNYVAAKAGVVGMTKTWARELARDGIRVNAVAPGFVATEILRSMPERVLQGMRDKTPLGRLGTPEDVAHANVYLASDRASFVTGTVLSVDGGLVL